MKSLQEYIKQGGRGTVAKIARHMGVSHNQVKRWRDGINKPSAYRLPRLRQMISEKVTVVTITDARGCDVTHG